MIILLDNNGLLIRYAAALQNDSNKNMHKYGGLFFYFKLIYRLIIKYPNAHIITFSDKCGVDNFRKKIISTYKENRAKLSSNIRDQILELDKMLLDMNITHIYHKEFEADDLIASYIEYDKSININNKYMIVSGDKDFMQLVDDQTSILNPFNNKNDTIIDTNYVFEKYKITPKNFILYQALMGDASDNIQGINGIGKVMAVKIIDSCGFDIEMIQNKYIKYNFTDLNIYINLVTLKKDIKMNCYIINNILLESINAVIIELKTKIYNEF